MAFVPCGKVCKIYPLESVVDGGFSSGNLCIACFSSMSKARMEFRCPGLVSQQGHAHQAPTVMQLILLQERAQVSQGS